MSSFVFVNIFVYGAFEEEYSPPSRPLFHSEGKKHMATPPRIISTLISLPPRAYEKTRDMIDSVSQSAHDLATEFLDQAMIHIVEVADQNATIAPPDSPPATRLAALLGRIPSLSSGTWNFKIYVSGYINACSFPNGSIRIHSGCLTLLDDDELLFIIAHELGHIELGHSLANAKFTVLSSLAKLGIAVAGPIGRILTVTQITELATQYIAARYSREQEYQADAFAVQWIRQNDLDQGAIISAMHKMRPHATANSSIFAPHPAFEDRFDRIRATLIPDALKARP